jgi:thioredoxin-like negative regulator of GroEL
MTRPLAAATALPGLERARLAAPRDTAVLYSLALAYAVTQQYERSRATLAALRAVSPDHAAARALLAQLPPVPPGAAAPGAPMRR